MRNPNSGTKVIKQPIEKIKVFPFVLELLLEVGVLLGCSI